MGRRSQLRVYTIAEGRLDEFVRLWSNGVRPLRERLGFRIDGAWTVAEDSRFVWVLSYEGPGDFEGADAAYYASDERKTLDPDPAPLIVDNQTSWLTPLE